MTRILYVSTSTTVGGAEKTVFSLATLLDHKRFTVTGVVSLKPFGAYAERLAAMGSKTFTLGMKSRPGMKEVRALCAIIERERPDVVHAVMYQAIQLSRWVKKRLAGKVRFRLVSSPRVNYRTRAAWTLLLDRLLKGQDDLLIAESQASRDFLVQRLGYAPAKVKTIYNGVELARWEVSKLERQHKRMELRLGSDDILIGAVGRLDPQKGYPALIDAVAKLRAKHPVRCVIIGEGPQRAKLEEQIRRLHLERHVWLLGETSDVPTWLSALEIVVLPSLWEGLPNSLLEAMAIGQPVVACAVDGVPEAVTHEVTGLLVPPRDVAALTRAIERLILDPALRAKLGAAAKEATAKKFALVDMMARYEQAYAEVMSR
ncbi:MAG: glycosyltransferase [Elusimicrobiota bacterium]